VSPEDASTVLRTTKDGVAWLTLNRPEKRNALNDRLIEELKAALREADADNEVRAIALRGAGKDFCSGADLSSLRVISDASVMENLQDVDSLAELFLLLRQLRKPVVAVVHGRALAGGCGLATACDLVLAAESARFGYPEVRIGFVPAMVMAILRRSVSEKRAFELIVRGSTLTAGEAERVGLINQALPDDGFESAAETYLSELAGHSASAVQLCKRLLYQQDGMSFGTAVRAGADLNVIARMTDDTQAGVARFLEKSDALRS
jgi:methylglutaconyl-CoA hydratase